MGDFYAAKKFYDQSLSKTTFVNHRIRKETLKRLWAINKKIGITGLESPEKTMLSRYYIDKKSV